MIVPALFAAVALAVPGPPASLVALELAGAPSSTPVTCTASVPQGEYGWAQWSPSLLVLLAPSVCDGLAWLQADEGRRGELERAQPFVGWAGLAGVAGLVMLHEAVHVAGVHDETRAECRALVLLPTLLGRYLAGELLGRALRAAAAYDGWLPAVYHEGGCSDG